MPMGCRNVSVCGSLMAAAVTQSGVRTGHAGMACLTPCVAVVRGACLKNIILPWNIKGYRVRVLVSKAWASSCEWQVSAVAWPGCMGAFCKAPCCSALLGAVSPGLVLLPHAQPGWPRCWGAAACALRSRAGAGEASGRALGLWGPVPGGQLPQLGCVGGVEWPVQGRCQVGPTPSGMQGCAGCSCTGMEYAGQSESSNCPASPYRPNLSDTPRKQKVPGKKQTPAQTLQLGPLLRLLLQPPR